MAHPEKDSRGAENTSQLDSLNSDVVEVTDVEVDSTVRPMRESLRQRLQQPPTLPVPTDPHREEQSS